MVNFPNLIELDCFFCQKPTGKQGMPAHHGQPGDITACAECLESIPNARDALRQERINRAIEAQQFGGFSWAPTTQQEPVNCPECGSLAVTPTTEPDEYNDCEYRCSDCGHYFVDTATQQSNSHS